MSRSLSATILKHFLKAKRMGERRWIIYWGVMHKKILCYPREEVDMICLIPISTRRFQWPLADISFGNFKRVGKGVLQKQARQQKYNCCMLGTGCKLLYWLYCMGFYCQQLLRSGERNVAYLNLCNNKQCHNGISSFLYSEQMYQSGSIGQGVSLDQSKGLVRLNLVGNISPLSLLRVADFHVTLMLLPGVHMHHLKERGTFIKPSALLPKPSVIT